MKDGKVPSDLKFINAARALVPRIEKVPSFLYLFIDLSYEINRDYALAGGYQANVSCQSQSDSPLAHLQ
jgi:hypothetical protein